MQAGPTWVQRVNSAHPLYVSVALSLVTGFPRTFGREGCVLRPPSLETGSFPLPTQRSCCQPVGNFLGIKVVAISLKMWEESYVIMKSLPRTKILLGISYD